MSHAVGAQHLHLACNVDEGPVFLAWRHEIDAEARCYDAAVALLCPVDGEGVEMVVAKIHHGEQLVHQSVAQPSLCILAHPGVGVPAVTAIA